MTVHLRVQREICVYVCGRIRGGGGACVPRRLRTSVCSSLVCRVRLLFFENSLSQPATSHVNRSRFFLATSALPAYKGAGRGKVGGRVEGERQRKEKEHVKCEYDGALAGTERDMCLCVWTHTWWWRRVCSPTTAHLGVIIPSMSREGINRLKLLVATGDIAREQLALLRHLCPSGL